MKEFITLCKKTSRGRVNGQLSGILRTPVSPSLFHCIPCIGFLGRTASGHRMAATEPATCAEDTIQRQKGEVLKANAPSKKACSYVSIDQNCIAYPFLLSLLLAKSGIIMADKFRFTPEIAEGCPLPGAQGIGLRKPPTFASPREFGSVFPGGCKR